MTGVLDFIWNQLSRQLGEESYMQKLLSLCGCQCGEDVTEDEPDGCIQKTDLSEWQCKVVNAIIDASCAAR